MNLPDKIDAQKPAGGLIVSETEPHGDSFVISSTVCSSICIGRATEDHSPRRSALNLQTRALIDTSSVRGNCKVLKGLLVTFRGAESSVAGK